MNVKDAIKRLPSSKSVRNFGGEMRNSRLYSDIEDEEIIKMWSEGASAAKIGRRLRRSASSIISRVHRLGLPGRPSPIKRLTLEQVAECIPKQSEPIQPRAAESREAFASIISTDTKLRPAALPMRAFVSRESVCLWPGVSAGELPCTDLRLPGKPYCAGHCDRAYVARKAEC